MKSIFTLPFYLIFTITLCAQTFTGKVIAVKDGDTIVLLHEKKKITVRLEHVDCPEKNQPFGYKAKQFVSGFCFSKNVKIISNVKRDRNGRWIAEVFYQNKNLGKELIKNGLAWHFKRFSKHKEYALLEIEARKKKIGLWQDAKPIAPWNWRDYKKQNSKIL